MSLKHLSDVLGKREIALIVLVRGVRLCLDFFDGLEICYVGLHIKRVHRNLNLYDSSSLRDIRIAESDMFYAHNAEARTKVFRYISCEVKSYAASRRLDVLAVQLYVLLNDVSSVKGESL